MLFFGNAASFEMEEICCTVRRHGDYHSSAADAARTATSVPAGRNPSGWYVYSESKLKNLHETTLRCFNYSHNEWQVTNEGNGVRITPRPSPRGKDDFPPVPSWPPLLKHQEGMPGRTVSAGLRSAMHFKNGWLLAYDAGEWGGGLWLTNEDGSKTKRILSDNVRAVVPIDGGIIVLSGLAHMSMERFRVVSRGGLEPPTRCLRGSCSTIELPALRFPNHFYSQLLTLHCLRWHHN